MLFHRLRIELDNAVGTALTELVRERAVRRRRLGDAVRVCPVPSVLNTARHQALGSGTDDVSK